MDEVVWHKSMSFKVPDNIRLVIILPAYSPALNPVEHIWDELREKGFHNRVFSNLDALKNHLVSELARLENTPEITHAIVA